MGILAPASPSRARDLEIGRSVLERMGLEVVMGTGNKDHCLAYLAGSDEHRASHFNEFVRDPSIRGLFCSRGGYGCLRILPKLSYSQLRLTPKALVGFSDLTALLVACQWQAGVVCFHGPTVSSLATADAESVESLWKALSSTEPLSFHFPGATCLREGIAVGSVLGGNLTTLCHLLGTPFFPPLTGRVLFLEDRGEAMYRIDRMLTQFLHSGSFGGVAALILGGFSQSGPRQELNELVQERLASTSFPILSGVTIGHERRNLTLPLGLTATLDAEARTLVYHQPATREP